MMILVEDPVGGALHSGLAPYTTLMNSLSYVCDLIQRSKRDTWKEPTIVRVFPSSVWEFKIKHRLLVIGVVIMAWGRWVLSKIPEVIR